MRKAMPPTTALLVLTCLFLRAVPTLSGEGGDLLERAQAGDIGAMLDLANSFLTDRDVEGNDERAFRWIEQAAATGDHRGLYALAWLHNHGRGVDEDKARACSLFERAAEKGNRNAMYSLGTAYCYGFGVEKDCQRSLEWFRKASDAGHNEAAYQIASLYLFNDRLGDNPCERLKWLRVSAKKDQYTPAMYAIGKMYEEGRCVEPDMDHALAWYRTAGDRGNSLAADRYEDLTTRHERGGMPKGQYDMERKAEAGDVDAMYGIGDFYLTASDDNAALKNVDKGIEWLEKAANAGNKRAMYTLYRTYHVGELVPKNPEAAFKWCEMAAKAGDVTLMKYVGDMYYDGKGVAQDGLMAAYWYEKLLGYADYREGLLLKLVRMFHYGEGAPADYCRAHSFCLRAVEMNYPWAMRLMGEMYERGQCVPKNYDQAMYWFTKAQDNGDTWAKYGIEKLLADKELLGIWIVPSAAQGSRGTSDRIIIPSGGKYTEYNTGFADANLREVLSKASAGDINAMAALGDRYSRGVGVDKDIDTGWRWYMKAAQSGNVAAQCYVGIILYNYNHAEKMDPRRGKEWLERAARQGSAPAQYALGEIEYKPAFEYYFYLNPEFNEEDFIDPEHVCRAFSWYEKAAMQDYPPAQRQIGFMYMNGDCVRADHGLGLLWLRAAAANGDQQADEFLKEEATR